jgi:PAS domain S-box-containing protein
MDRHMISGKPKSTGRSTGKDAMHASDRAAAQAGGAPKSVDRSPSHSVEALQRAALAVSQAGGRRVYEKLVTELADILAVDVAFVAVYDDSGRSRMRTLAAWLDGRLLRSFDYALAGTPCARVVGRRFHFIAQGVAAELDPATIFAAKGMDAYAAYPLFDAAGEPLGLLVTMSRTRLVDAMLVESMLKIFAVRMAAEIERERSEEALRRAALAVSGAEGENIYVELVRALATIVGVEIAFIALPRPDDPCTLRMLAFYLDGRIVEDFEYPLAGTPCEKILSSGYCAYPDRLVERFPLDADFRAIGAESYAGLRLCGADGAPLGIISVVSRKPLPNLELVESMLKIFAARARNEIERGRADAALRASEEQYRAIFNASVDALVLWNSSLQRVDVNPAYERIHGFTREEVLRSDYRAGLPAEYAERRRDLVQRTLAGESCVVELESVRKNGERIDIEVRTIPVQHRGEPHVLAIIRDVTERKRIEAAARASEEQYREIFNASIDGISLWDDSGRIVDVNPAFLAMHGYEREEIVGAECPPFIPDEGREGCRNLLRSALAGERSQHEQIARHKNGTMRNVEIRTVPIRYHDRPHALTFVRDITASKRADAQRAALEAQLRQAQKMEAIGHLTGGIAHDFNNILQSIVGYIVLAGERQEELRDPRLGHYLQQVHAAAQRAGLLIRQMLTFSRGHRGERKALRPAPLVQETTQMLRATLPSTITLHTSAATDAPPVLVDPVQFEQVLLNLSINARDAMRSQGEIQVAVGLVRRIDAVCASCRKGVSGDFVELAVRDSGPGIPPEIAEHMFEPFYTTKDVGKGSGMGLAMVHGIVHDHGGHILLDTRTGEGTTFRVLFQPIETPSRPPTDTDSSLPVAGANSRLKGRVLVADDEAAVRELMRDLLDGWGLDVVVAQSGVEALAAFSADPGGFDLVLTDQTMSGMTGVALAREVTRLRPGLPVLLCTGFGEDLPDEAILAAGIRFVARKPVEPAELRVSLGRLLSTTPIR